MRFIETVFQKLKRHPKRIVCTRCGADDLQWRAASGRGRVYSCSEVHRAPAPEFAASVPYWVGLVALEEGVQRVHFIDGRLPHSLLLEIFTAHGMGTEIVQG